MTSTQVSSLESEVLSPAEVDQLVAEAQSAGASGLASGPGATADGAANSIVQPFAFRGESFLTPQELRALRSDHDAWVGILAARLSSYLRTEFALRLCEVQALPYEKLVESLGAPCHLSLFKVEPWRGICLLELNAKLALAISDRLLGGKGTAPAETRDLSAVESALLDQVVQIILCEWCGHWTQFQPLTPVLLGHENSGRFLRVSQPEAMTVTVALEARLGECVAPIQLAFPGVTLEAVLQELRVKSNLRLDESSSARTAGPVKWRKEFDSIRVPVAARWNALRVTAGQLAQLAIGDVLPLPPEFSNRIQLCLAGTSKFVGRLGTCENTWAVEVTEVLRT